MFVNRDRELGLLSDLLSKRTASFVVCKGRRRIGKSKLIEVFAGKAKSFLEFQGLPPREGQTNQNQLDAFAEQLARQTSLPRLTLSSWPQVFELLAGVLKNERTVVLLDEISWMSGKDKDFAGHLKIAWDTKLKKHPGLILVACGSVSSWIDTNILGSTGFVGRVSLQLQPGELSLPDCNRFWRSRSNRVAAYEKLKLLSVTGGVPRYLEEIQPNRSAEHNINRMCFSKEGILFSEFERIFDDIFSKRAPTYKEIVKTLVSGSKTVSQISSALGKARSGHTSEHLKDLIASGFVHRDTFYAPGRNRPSRMERYRLRDNYLRFYLRYIEPLRTKIEQGITDDVNLESLVDWETIMGFQFENLVLNNLPVICDRLSLKKGTVKSAAPFFQRRTNRLRGCQIDLLIQTKHTLYLCEIRFRKRINRNVVDDVKEKIARLPKPSSMTVRPVLIYEGELDPGIGDTDFFDASIRFGDLLSA